MMRLCSDESRVWFSYLFFFFFSSRRRHTRLQGDWSSDVCSSDLGAAMTGVLLVLAAAAAWLAPVETRPAPRAPRRAAAVEIGRASCRGRGEVSGVGGALERKGREDRKVRGREKRRGAER